MDKPMFLRFWYVHLFATMLVILAMWRGLGALQKSRLGHRLIRSTDAFQRLRCAVVSLALASVAALPWYVMNFQSQMTDLQVNVETSPGLVRATLNVLQFTSRAWLGSLLMLAAGLALLARKGPGRRSLALLAAGLLGASLLLVMSSDPQPRFMLPLLPFVAVLATWFFRLMGFWRLPAALCILALQAPMLNSINERSRSDTSLLAADLVIPTHMHVNQKKNLKDEQVRCRVAQRQASLAEELRSLGPIPPVLCLVRDRAHQETISRQDEIPGFSCATLRSSLGLPGGWFFQSNLQEDRGRAEQGQADIPEKVLIIYPERQGRPWSLFSRRPPTFIPDITLLAAGSTHCSRIWGCTSSRWCGIDDRGD